MSYLDDLADQIKEAFTQDIDIDNLIPSKDNFYGIRDIEELADSIKNTRLMHNLVVRKVKDGKYEILAGERRYRALLLLSTKKAPCLVVDLNDIDAKLFMIESNAQQRELTVAEKMKQIKMLEELYATKKKSGEKLPKGKKTRDLIGEKLGMSGPQVGKYQAIENNLIEPLKDKLNDGDITLTQATTLSGLKVEEQEVIHEQIKDINSKESKAEVDILVEGIKQPISNKEDEELLEEMYPNVEAQEPFSNEEHKEETNSNEIDINQSDTMYSTLCKLLEYDSLPKVVICAYGIEAILYTSKITIESEDSLNIRHKLSIKLSGFGRDNIISVPLSTVLKVDKLPNGLTPKMAYKVHDGLYLWFKRKVGDE